jgi:hypothetical protein
MFSNADKDLNNKLNKDGVMYHKFPSSFLFKKKISKNYEPKKDCAHPLEHINIINKECFKKICEKLKLKITKIDNLGFINQMRIQKNNFLFNQVILKK